MADGRDAGILHGNKSEVVNNGRGEFLGHPHAKIVTNTLLLFQKARVPPANTANERKHERRQDDGCAFGTLELHPVGLNKKPAQFKATLVFRRENLTTQSYWGCPLKVPAPGEMYTVVVFPVTLTVTT